MSAASRRRRALRRLSLAGLLVIGGCTGAERPDGDALIEPGAAPPVEEDQALSGRDLAFDLIAMVDVRAARPATRAEDFVVDDGNVGGRRRHARMLHKHHAN